MGILGKDGLLLSLTYLPTRLTVVSLLTMGLITSRAGAQTSFAAVKVPGTSVIFDPDGIADSVLPSLRTAGSLSPTAAVKAMSFSAAPGQTFTFSATGWVGCCGTANIGPDGYPDNATNITSLSKSPISGFISPNGLPLLGVFTDGFPNDTPAPAPYNYSAGIGQATFSPQLNQVFIIGDGLTGTGSGTKQIFKVPRTATELWLGFADGGTFQGPPANYGDNAGFLTVSGTLLDCANLIDFDHTKIRIFPSKQLTNRRIVDNEEGVVGVVPYEQFTAGGLFEYGITIDANTSIRLKTGVDPANAPTLALAQDLTKWAGSSTYGGIADQYEAYPSPPAAVSAIYNIMDNIGNLVGPIWTPYAKGTVQFTDSPAIHVPLRYKKDGPLLTSINYTKGFTTYIGCSSVSTSESVLQATFHPLATVSWSVNYTGRFSEVRGILFNSLEFIPASDAGVVAPSTASLFPGSSVQQPQLNLPTASCFTSFKLFDGTINNIPGCNQ